MNDDTEAQHDAYLAGVRAAQSWSWWAEFGPEEEADRLNLQGDRRADFLRGWNDEIARQEHERKSQKWRDYEAMAQGYKKGDPAHRTAWKGTQS